MVPEAATSPFDVCEYDEAQMEAFWAVNSHVPFGMDADGNVLWPDYGEVSVAVATPPETR